MSNSSVASAPESPSAGAAVKALHEIRLVGRGGQGIVTAGDLLGKAAVLEGRHAQSVPAFGPERRGALSSCTLRVSDREILLKCSSVTPNILLLIDPTIWHHANVLLGLKPGATLIFNTPHPPTEIDRDLRSGHHGYRPPVEDFEVVCVDATGIAMEVMGQPIPNTAMMGALHGATGIVGMDSIKEALAERFGEKAEMNFRAAETASDRIVRLGG
jgi:pyruvate ferredoxin oxidoreductase gamma subunit/2-oxoisovalerate ferredoxin oxidoreductase gamma subunit